MSQLLGNELSEALLQRLRGQNVAEHRGKAIVIVTVDENGWGHPAMLSYHEVVAKDLSTIDIAIGKTSTTGKNLRYSGKITLLITDHGVNFYVKGNSREIRESMEKVPFMSLFRVNVEQLLEDQEPEAEITSGVTFKRPEKKQITDLVEKVFQGLRAEP